MRVEINNVKKDVDFEVGDVIAFDDTNIFTGKFYIIFKDYKQGYIIRSLVDGMGATGFHSTIEDLKESIEEYGYTHYSKREYKLSLERI